MQYKHTPQEAQKLWIDALRSDKYKQGRNRLKTDDQYCCLGVACDLFAEYEGVGKWGIAIFDNGLRKEFKEKFVVDNSEEVYYLPYQVRDWLGLTDSDGSCVLTDDSDDQIPAFPVSLSDLNDSSRKTFKEIACIIESKPQDMFVN